ncbi:MAG TPA: hypothetical protein VGK06_13010 [Methanosarcina sp.]|jgi:plastocyanin
MKTKIIVLLLIFSTILLSGCTGNEQPSSEKNATPEENVTPEENATTVENTTVVETLEENATTVENKTAEGNITSEKSNGTTEKLTISSPKIQETPYLVRLKNHKASSSGLEIKKGESISWINMEDSPKRLLTLVSGENLFDNKSLSYKRDFTYAFNETGDYHFTVVGQPRMDVNVSVAEP